MLRVSDRDPPSSAPHRGYVSPRYQSLRASSLRSIKPITSISPDGCIIVTRAKLADPPTLHLSATVNRNTKHARSPSLSTASDQCLQSDRANQFSNNIIVSRVFPILTDVMKQQEEEELLLSQAIQPASNLASVDQNIHHIKTSIAASSLSIAPHSFVSQFRSLMPEVPVSDACEYCLHAANPAAAYHENPSNVMRCPNFLAKLVESVQDPSFIPISRYNVKYLCNFSPLCREDLFCHEENQCPMRKAFRTNQMSRMLNSPIGRKHEEHYRITIGNNKARKIEDLDIQTQMYNTAGCILLVSDTSVNPPKHYVLFGDRKQRAKRKGQYLAACRTRHTLDLPKGKRKCIQELPLQCAVREAREELGLRKEFQFWNDAVDPTLFHRLDHRCDGNSICCIFGIPFGGTFMDAQAIVSRYNSANATDREFRGLHLLSLEEIFANMYKQQVAENKPAVYWFIQTLFHSINQVKVLQEKGPAIDNIVDNSAHPKSLQHTSEWELLNPAPLEEPLPGDLRSKDTRKKFQQFETAILQFCSVENSASSF